MLEIALQFNFYIEKMKENVKQHMTNSLKCVLTGDDSYIQCILWNFMLGALTEDFSFCSLHHQVKT